MSEEVSWDHLPWNRVMRLDLFDDRIEMVFWSFRKFIAYPETQKQYDDLMKAAFYKIETFRINDVRTKD